MISNILNTVTVLNIFDDIKQGIRKAKKIWWHNETKLI